MCGKSTKIKSFGGSWLINELFSETGLERMVDDAMPTKMTGMTVGRGIALMVASRMLSPVSHNLLSEKLGETAIEEICPGYLKNADSAHFGRVMDRFSIESILSLTNKFLLKLRDYIQDDSETFYMDQTNYSCRHNPGKTNSELLQFGNSKKKLHHLLQYGMSVTISGKTRIPVYCNVYPGGWHDSKEFTYSLPKILDIIRDDNIRVKKYISHDKGNESELARLYFKNETNIYYISTHSLRKKEALSRISLDLYDIFGTEKNRLLIESGHIEDTVRYYVLPDNYFGDGCKWIIVYNPRTAEKHNYTIKLSLKKMHEFLAKERVNFNKSERSLEDALKIEKNFEKYCHDHKYSHECYSIIRELKRDGTYNIKYHKNPKIIEALSRFSGKNLITSDDPQQSALDMYLKSNGNWRSELCFKSMKNHFTIAMEPTYVRRDHHIAVNAATGVIAEAHMRFLELKLKDANLKITAQRAISIMNSWHCKIVYFENGKKPIVAVERPNKVQALILKAFGYHWARGGIYKIGVRIPKRWGWSRRPGRPPGARNKAKVACPPPG